MWINLNATLEKVFPMAKLNWHDFTEWSRLFLPAFCSLIHFGLIWFERVSLALHWLHKTVWMNRFGIWMQKRKNERRNDSVVNQQQSLLDLYFFYYSSTTIQCHWDECIAIERAMLWFHSNCSQQSKDKPILTFSVRFSLVWLVDFVFDLDLLRMCSSQAGRQAHRLSCTANANKPARTFKYFYWWPSIRITQTET